TLFRSEIVDGDLHRGARAQRRVKEDERDAAPRQRALGVIARLDARGQVEQPGQLVAREVRRAEKVSAFHFHLDSQNCIVASSLKNRSISARLRVSGGNSRSTLASSARPVM